MGSIFDRIRQTVSNLRKSAQQGIADWATRNPQTATKIVNFAEPRAQAVTQKLQNPYQFNFANKIASNIKQPIPRAVVGVPLGMAQGVMNAPGQYWKGVVNTGLNLGDKWGGRKVSNSELIGNAAGLANSILTLGMMGRTPNMANNAINNLAKKRFVQAVSEGAQSGGKYGAAFGALGGLEENKNAPNVPQQFIRTVPSTVGGYISGLGVGGVLGGVGYGINAWNGRGPDLTPPKTNNQPRNKTGQWTKGGKAEKPFYDEYWKDLGLKSNVDNRVGIMESRINVPKAKPPVEGGVGGKPKYDERLPGIMYTTSKAKAEGKNYTELPWETPEFKKANPNFGKETINTDKGTQYQANIKGGSFTGQIDEKVKGNFADWVNQRKATKVEGMLKQREFSDLDATGPEGFAVFQEGFNKGRYKDVKKYFDTKYNEVKDTGIDVHYKKNYLPQLWANTEQEIQQKLGRSLGTTPSFSLESVIKDYKEGINAGLTPKFNSISQLVGWYEKTANKAIADKNYFHSLAVDGLIQPGSKAPKDWISLDPDRFPKVRVHLPDNAKYQGVFKAPPELANMINNYLREPQSQVMNTIANYVSRAKNITLSFGVPNTGINAHGVNILARHTLFGTGGNPVTRLLTGVKYMINPGSAEKALVKDLSTAPKAIKSGLTLSAEEHTALLNEVESIAKSFGKGWNNAFEKPLFNKMIPALKLSSFNELVKNGMVDKDAAKLVNNVYGGINWEQLGRNRDTQNLIRTLILAPDWAESSLRMGGNIAKSLFTKGPIASRYRTMGATLLGAIVTANIANKLSSGHYMYENDPGHTFEIEAGYTGDGQKRYIRPFGTAVDFVRLPVDAALGLMKGDPTPTFRAISNRLSIPLGSAMHLMTNADYTGRAIYGKDKYGKEIPLTQAAGGIGGELAGMVGFPSFAKNFIDVGTGRQGLEQGLTQGFELPFRYSGGYFSPTDKQVADSLGVKGKERYDLSTTLRDQAPLSARQRLKVKEGGKEQLNKIVDTRAKDKAKNQAIEAFLNGDKETAKQLQQQTKFTVKSSDIVSAAKQKAIEAFLKGDRETARQLQQTYKFTVTRKDIYGE